MKKNKVIIVLFFVVIMLMVILPNKCVAYSKELRDISINQTTSLVVGPLSFSSISFKNFSEEPGIFGLVGLVENNGSVDQKFYATANFYDENHNIIVTITSNQYVQARQKNTYNNVDNITKIKNGYTANDIKYYSLTIGTSDVENNVITSNSIIKNSKYDYIIEKYHINMVVNEDNTFDITETITTNFNISKHGIFRKIPLKNTIKRLDGTKSKNTAQITNIKVSEKFKTSNENGYKVIKIGDASKTLIGTHIYTIKYTYNIGKDPLKNVDELYFNLIGSEWDTQINDIIFTIKMPKEFDKSLLGFSTGEVGSTHNSNISYTVNQNVINGKVTDTLNPGEALTIRMELPEGYFVGAGHKVDFFSVSIIAICMLFVVIAYRMWAKHGKDDQIIETVEFYPPEGYNSAELGFLYKGKSDNESIISLLIYLADKGYLKIEEIEEKILFSKTKGFKITKLKEYDGDNEIERIFFEGLFRGSRKEIVDLGKAIEIRREYKLNGEKISFSKACELATDIKDETNKEFVTSNELTNKFYMTLQSIKSKLESKENKRKIFETVSTGKSKWLILMIIAIFVLITIKPMLEYSEAGVAMLPFALIFPGVGFTVLFTMVFGTTNDTTIYVNGKPSKSSLAPKIFGLVWGGMFGGIPWAFMVLPCLLQNMIYLITYFIGIVCIVTIVIFKKIMPKRTPYGNEILGKIKGFKRFLETAEKPQLESLVMQNPEYFYNILPYTYVLGVSEIWMNQFETIAIKSPNWYDSIDNFNMSNFNKFMNSTMNSASAAMSSSPSSGGGSGGSSGGGSSGGGSGGGGGGSW